MEKIFPLYSPIIDRIEITKRSKVKRSKLYYIREKALKQISKRMRMMFVDIKTEEIEPSTETPVETSEEKNEEELKETNEEKEEVIENIETSETPTEVLEEK